jgi:glycosyltransferase involved in cell wall biosynthesis
MRHHFRSLTDRLLPKDSADTVVRLTLTNNDVQIPAELELDFYRAWHSDLRAMDDTALVRHWEQFGKKEERAPSFAALVEIRGLDSSTLPSDFSVDAYLQRHPSLAEDAVKSRWAAMLHYLENSAPLLVEVPLEPEAEEGLPLPAELDLDFYRSWHHDLAGFADASLVHHWKQFGEEEGRAPSFASLLEARDLDIDTLPRDFCAETYLKLNAHLVEEGIRDAWAATLHYLTSDTKKKGEYRFDKDFYTSYFRDVALFKGDPIKHFVNYGKSEGRMKTSAEYWTKKNLQASELESLIDVELFLAVNSDLAGGSEHLATKWNIVDYLIEKGVEEARPIASASDVSANAYYYVGNAMISRGEKERAEKAYLAACSFEPRHAQALQHLGDIYLTDRRWLEAIELYFLVLEASASSANVFWTHYNLSIALDAAGQTVRSIDHLRQARILDPNMHHARDRHEHMIKREWEKLDLRARTMIKVGDLKKAEELYREADALLETLFAERPVPSQPIGTKPRVALVVDPFLPQCVRYRVEQKVEQFLLLEWHAEVLHWNKIAKDSFAALAFADVVVFYRVPALFDVAHLMKQCRHAGKAVVFEIDDLVFDKDLYPEPLSSYGGLINAEEYRNLVRGTLLFRTALQGADYALASTKPLAEHMAPLVRTGQAFVHRNGLDVHTELLLERPRRKRNGAPLIFYGTGTKAHNADFDDLVAPALARILEEYPKWKLLVAGYLTLPSCLASYEERTVRVGFIPNVDAYLNLLGEAEINIAVLHENEVNDSKSELKWFEAGVQGIPSVVSPTRNYFDVTHPGHDVLVAANPEEWYQELKRLVIDPDFRRAVGENARMAACRYTSREQSQTLASIFADIASDWNSTLPQRKARQKIVIVNVFFPPQSIGGATRVVEDNVHVLLERYSEQFDIEIFTSDHENPVPYMVSQYGWNGIRVTKVSTPQKAGMDWDYQNKKIETIFDEYLEQVQPSLVHFHCVQRLTASIIEATQERGIPYLVTAHDAWWISDYQFLVGEDGKLCDMRQNDIAILATQSKDLVATLARQEYLRTRLEGAKAVLAVSEAFAEIYRLNGFKNVLAVRNGVMPHEWLPRSVSASGKVRVAHIGGMSNHKGYHLFQQALEVGGFENIEALVVDLSKPYGYSSKSAFGNVPVTFIGRVPHEHIEKIYSQFDVLVAPSIWPESFGLVTREAVAAGCWVIASDIGAIGEDVMVGENGFVIEAGSADKLKTVFAEINSDHEIYCAVNRNREARKVDEQVRELIEIYASVVDEMEK